MRKIEPLEPKDVREVIPSAEVRGGLDRLGHCLRAAHCSDIDVDESYKLYVLAYKELAFGNDLDAFMHYQKAGYELTNALNDSKHKVGQLRVHSLRTMSFIFKLYGLYAAAFGLISSTLFIALIYLHSGLTVLEVPLWSTYFAGLGSSAQILSGVAEDVRSNGMALRYKRMWYIVIPVVAMIFGYMAYILMGSGVVAFNVNSQERVLSTMVVCFITGFSTNWAVGRLSGLSR